MVTEISLNKIYQNKDDILSSVVSYNIPKLVIEDLFQDTILALLSIKIEPKDPIRYFVRSFHNNVKKYVIRNKKIVYTNKFRDVVDEPCDAPINIEYINTVLELFNPLISFIIREHIYRNKTFKQIANESGGVLTESIIKKYYYKAIKKIRDDYSLDFFLTST